MAKFRKKPVVIDAVQWFEHGDHPRVKRRLDSASDLWGFIETLEGEMRVIPGDWVITGVAGEVYPCKDEIFRATYEPAEQAHGEAADLIPSEDIAWVRFNAAFTDGDAPYPGMIAAFENHYGQSFADKDWRREASVWAQAWHAATRANVAPPAREPLSNEQIFDLAEPFGAFRHGDAQGDKRIEFARAIEKAVWEKNGG